ncbi:MAG: aldo/keto reductase [Gammaproteobacteria bacterium]|nr:aldo/keto reductase [Gammaproteobacteria bacterium]
MTSDKRKLDKRKLGTTDVEVTELGFGGAPLGAGGGRVNEEDAAAIIRAANDGGIRYFDTAPLYGHGLSEKRVGGVLREIERDAFALSTKVGRLLVPIDEGERNPGMRDAEPFAIRYDYTYDAARASLDASLTRLGIDRVDILLCHDIDVWTHGDAQPGIFETAAAGILPALNDLRSEGVIRAFGLGVNEPGVCSQVMDHFDVDCFLLAGRFTLLEQAPLDEMLPKCVEHNVSVIIGGPYNSGLLAVTERSRATYDYKPVDDARWQRAQAIRAVCDAHDVDIRAAALRYPLRHPAVASVIPGCRAMDEVSTNLDLIGQTLPDSLWSDLANEGLARTF